MNYRFIVTQDEQMAKTLLESKFKLFNKTGSTYTFLNEVPDSFNFANFDRSKIAYTNIFSM